MASKDKTIPISFREDEMWMKREIEKHHGKSGFVKDVLAEYFEKNGISPDKQQCNNSVPAKMDGNLFGII